MKDITMAWYIPTPGGSLSAAKPFASVGNRVVKTKALFAQIQQMYTPGRFITMILSRQQITVGRIDIHAHQYGFAGLIYFIVSANTNSG